MNNQRKAVLRRYTIEEVRIPAINEIIGDTLSFIDIRDVESQHVVLSSIAQADNALNDMMSDHDHDENCDCEQEFIKWQAVTKPLPF